MSAVAVVTGAAAGLGRAVVQELLAHGYRVAGFDIREGDPAEGLLQLTVDVTDEAAVEAAFDRVVQDLGRPTLAVNAAGIYPRTMLSDFSVDRYRRIFDINVLGTWLVTRGFYRTHEEGTPGTVLNIASVDGMTPHPKSLLYSASKAAVINLTAGTAGELAAKGIRTVAVAPAYIATEQIKAQVGTLPPEAMSPQELAASIVRLADPALLTHLTGQTVVAQGREEFPSA
ncbi:SDR family NAD(P)-dependent oxidoreductase [Kineococcus sp. SYSU DK001]|uniref:SDR family NAD(P)-dependent oxidoreductase n=1 Tax=Kineococcus sp. SYSU DK001 TaxID=3383122 RepID=UPI003D7CF453